MHVDENERQASFLARALYFYTWRHEVSGRAKALNAIAGARIPITFGYDTDVLGSYTRAGAEHGDS